MKQVIIGLLLVLSSISYAQEVNTKKLDKFFNSLEKRNEAMGSIVLSKNGKVLYSKTIGIRYNANDTMISANPKTKYRIWSTTKLITATMILQLVEEGKLSLNTPLDKFFPQIPNSEIITIESMLRHKSGIHDFTQNPSSENWDANFEEPLTPDFMIRLISGYPSDFQPFERQEYSNSNYLLLGYIIENLDKSLYDVSLENRISSKANLKNTHFSSKGLKNLRNKALSFRFAKEWEIVDEGEFSGLVPGGAGGILSTPSDLAKFIEALFKGKLLSRNSLKKMLKGKESYKMGVMTNHFNNNIGYGHTGGNIASESSLFFYPEDSLTVAYCTNGIVIRKEQILNHVLQIYQGQPFNISMDRNTQALIILSVLCLLFVILLLKFRDLLEPRKLLYLGYAISLIFWLGMVISGLLFGGYSHRKDGVFLLDSFYSNSGTTMSSVNFIFSLLCIPFCYALYKSCKKLRTSIIPITPFAIIILSFLGSALYPSPNSLNTIFVNAILLSFLSPLFGMILWRKKAFKRLQLISFTSLFIMLVSIGLFIGRPFTPEFVSNNFGIIQRLFYIGLTLWIVSTSYYFIKDTKLNTENLTNKK